MCPWLNGFNASIWHALWLVLPLGIGIYFYFFLTLSHSSYFFDPKHNGGEGFKNAGDFEPHSKRYQELSKLTITLSAAAIAFIIGVLINDKLLSPFGQKLNSAAPVVVGFFGCCIALLLSFMLFQTVWYEEYCHSAGHETYTRGKYALSYAFAVTGLFSFIIGFIWLAANLFKR